MVTLFSSRNPRRRISSPPPPVTFRPALLLSEISESEAHEADLHAGGNPVGKQPRTGRHAPPLFGSLLSTRRRVGARVGAWAIFRCRNSTSKLVRPPSCCSIPPAVHPEPSLSTFLPILPPQHSVSHLLHSLGLLFLHLQFHSRDFKFHSRASPSY